MSDSRALALAWKHNNAPGISTRIDDGGEFEITGWPEGMGPAPNDAVLAVIVADYEAAMAPERVRESRRAAMPAGGDQFDAIWKQFEQDRAAGKTLAPEADAMLEDVLTVTRAHPKP
jgi:hypothetical protein